MKKIKLLLIFCLVNFCNLYSEEIIIERIKISLGEQKLYAYKDDAIFLETKISTGKKGRSTPKGEYVVTEKDKSHHSNKYGSYSTNKDGKRVFRGASMPFFMRLTDDGVGMHAGYVPNYPASHGCIRIPRAMAEKLYKVTPIQTQVTIED